MKAKTNIIPSSKTLAGALFLLACMASVLLAASSKQESAAPAGNAKQFDEPKQAVDSLVQAAASFDQTALLEILGPDSADIINSEDSVQDKQRATDFAAKAKAKQEIVVAKDNPNHAIVTVGADDFELPIPLVRNKGKWSFDTKVAREEILNRRIGSNELNAIAVCRGFVEAQHEYAGEKHDGSKVNQYAQRIISTEGKHDGLAWKNPDGTWAGPVGEAVAKAIEQGYSKKDEPFCGYFFKVLKGQDRRRRWVKWTLW